LKILLPLFLIILLPSMEVYLLFSWIADAPFFALPYLAATILLGFVCMGVAKIGVADIIQHVTQTRRGELLPESTRALLALGKMWVIGVLLIFPGYLTDILAVLIWLLAGRKRTDDDNRKTVDVDAHLHDRG